jgi:excisionase family DNA binding protein
MELRPELRPRSGDHMQDQDKEVYSVQEFAKKLDVKEATVRSWLRKGEIKGRRIGRKWFIPKIEMEKILNP